MKYSSVMLFAIVLMLFSGKSSSQAPARLTSATVHTAGFIENSGQFDSPARYVLFGRTGTVFISGAGAEFRPRGRRYSYRSEFTGARPAPVITGEDPLPFVHHYFIGRDPEKHATHVPVYRRIRIENLYDGIDLVYRWEGGTITRELQIASGADPADIQLTFETDDPDIGDLPEKTGLPLFSAHTTLSGSRYDLALRKTTPVSAAFVPAKNGNSLRLNLADTETGAQQYELSASTYLGGGGQDAAYGIAVDDAGYIYVTGETSSNDFPTGGSAYDSLGAQYSWDVFVSKFDPAGEHLLYSTFIGGGFGMGIDLDDGGNIIVAGYTFSEDFPVTPQAYDTTGGESMDVFACKLNPAGDELLYSTYIGGLESDQCRDMAVDPEGNACLSGYTHSADFPVTPNAFDTSYAGSTEMFVLKLNSDGSDLIFSSFLGGSGRDETVWGGIDADESGNVCLSGYTDSDDFPVTANALDSVRRGIYDEYMAFAAVFSTDGSELLYSTYLGGSYHDIADDIAFGPGNTVCVTGHTGSADFPVPPNAFDTLLTGYQQKAFLTAIDISTGELVYSTFFGGGDDEGRALTVDDNGYAYLTGATETFDFPVTQNALSLSLNGGSAEDWDDAFLTVLDIYGGGLVYSTYIGGSINDYGRCICLDRNKNVYIGGYTSSSDFPVTQTAFMDTRSGEAGDYYDAIVLRLSEVVSTVPERLPVPRSSVLHANYPNPFNPATNIRFTLPAAGNVTLKIYSLTGQEIRTLVDGTVPAGEHVAIWDGRNAFGVPVSSGIYIYRLVTENRSLSRKMVLLK